MKSILVLRHAKSSWKYTNLTDFQRPLNKRGKRDAPRMGSLITKEDLVPDLIISSPAERAITTAEAAAQACNYENEIQTSAQFYHGGTDDFVNALRHVPNEINRVMLVGHNPGMEDFVDDLSGEWITMPTAALVHIEIPLDDWANLSTEINGTIKQIWLPKELP